jgi:hypothetical protein
VVVRRRREDRYAHIARLGFGDGATHSAFVPQLLPDAGPGVEENRAVPPAEAVNDAIPVVDGAKAAAKKEQRRCAAWVVDRVKLSVGSRELRWRDMFGPFALGLCVEIGPIGRMVTTGVPFGEQSGQPRDEEVTEGAPSST